MKKLLVVVCAFVISAFAQEYKVNVSGQEDKETLTFYVDFEQDEQQKPITLQKLDIRDLPNITSLKILITPGLKGTLADEREVLVYYKTSLEISGLKIRNLYKVAVVRVYGGEKELNLSFDKDHYQNIVSFLKYHNITSETIKDIDNLYGTWDEVEFYDIKNPANPTANKEVKQIIPIKE